MFVALALALALDALALALALALHSVALLTSLAGCTLGFATRHDSKKTLQFTLYTEENADLFLPLTRGKRNYAIHRIKETV